MIPSENQVESLVADIQAIQERIASFTVSLAPEERLGGSKMRTGGESIVTAVAQLAEKHQLALPQITVEGMMADLTLAQRLRPLAVAVQELSERVNDTIATAQAECWWSATASYTTLARAAAVGGARRSSPRRRVPVSR